MGVLVHCDSFKEHISGIIYILRLNICFVVVVVVAIGNLLNEGSNFCAFSFSNFSLWFTSWPQHKRAFTLPQDVQYFLFSSFFSFHTHDEHIHNQMWKWWMLSVTEENRSNFYWMKLRSWRRKPKGRIHNHLY